MYIWKKKKKKLPTLILCIHNVGLNASPSHTQKRKKDALYGTKALSKVKKNPHV